MQNAYGNFAKATVVVYQATEQQRHSHVIAIACSTLDNCIRHQRAHNLLVGNLADLLHEVEESVMLSVPLAVELLTCFHEFEGVKDFAFTQPKAQIYGAIAATIVGTGMRGDVYYPLPFRDGELGRVTICKDSVIVYADPDGGTFAVAP